MAYDEQLASRVRKLLVRRRGLTERKMFGGIAFMLHGHMCCGVVNENLVLRLGDDGAGKAMHEPHVRPMDFTGKPLKSMVYVDPAGTAADDDLKAWIRKAATFTATLPPR